MSKRIGIVRALKDAVAIRRSGLFQAAYYKYQFYKELNIDRYLLRLSPLLHYVLYGSCQNKNPNPLFDDEYYRDHNPDVDRTRQNPLAHYVRIGARKRLNAGPFFDTGYYIDQYPEVAISGLNPLLHYLVTGKREGHHPNPLAATINCVEKPHVHNMAEGRRWLQLGLGASSVTAPRSPHRADRLIRFEWDPAGWNNIRMQVEVLVCLAARTNRALVLPDPSQWYLIPGDSSHLFDFFNEAAFRAAVPTVPSDTRLTDEWEVPARLAAINTVRLKKKEFLQQKDRQCWYFPSSTRMFGCLASVLGSYAGDYRLVHQAFRVRDDLLDKASHLLKVHGLKPGGFLAAHVRRGDFRPKAVRYLSVDNVIEALYRHGADRVGTVLIVSDAYDEELLDKCRKRGWETVCWSSEQSEDEKFAGVLDMLCCCLAWRFVGSALSTFSNGIFQWRGYVSRVAEISVDAVPRFTADPDTVPWWGTVDEHAWLSTDPASSSS